MGIENNGNVERNQEQTIEKNEHKHENQEQIDNKLSQIENRLTPSDSKDSKDNNGLLKEQDGLKKNDDKQDSGEKEIKESKTKEENKELSDDKLNSIESSLQPKVSESITENQGGSTKEDGNYGENKIEEPKESKEDLEKRLEKIQERKSLEDYDRLLPSEKEANDKEENELKEKLKSYEKSEEQQDGENKTEELKESKEDLEKRLEQVEERKSLEDYDRLLPSEKEANDKEENELKEKLKSYEKSEKQQNGENKTKEPKESKEDLEKRLEQVEERKSSEDYDRLLPSEKEANDKEENELKEKLKSYEKSEEQQDGENKTEEPKESKEDLEKRLEQIQERKSSEDYDRLLPSEKEANDKEENELKEKLKSYEKSEEQQDGENKTEEPKESKEDLEKRLEQIQERKSSEDYDRLLPSEKETNDKKENELKEKLKSYENPKEQLNQEASINKSKQDISEVKIERNKVQEEKLQTIEEKLNNIENSLQPKSIEDNEINIEEESANIENDLGTVEHNNSLEDNEKIFTNNKEEGNVKEKQTKDEGNGELESSNNNQVENIKYDESSKYDIPTSSDANNELSKALEPFEQSKWDSMDMDERKAVISELGNSIASDLNLQEKPEFEYYSSSNEGDFGGYSPSENAIYINEHNIGDAAETTDTIAHESRHCWQHERAENPQNEQDIAFKENFEDYINPEDDYRGYKNQPVEVDAREYARNVAANIPKETDPQESDSIGTEIGNTSEQDIQKLSEEKGSVFDKILETYEDLNRKTVEFESKLKDLEQYDSNLDYSIQQKLEEYYGINGGELSGEQKSDLVSEFKILYDQAANSERGDILVPENAKDVSIVCYYNKSDIYDIGYSWKPVDTKPETREMEIMRAGQQFDRLGPPTGRCVGAVDENGDCATLEQRSIPYHFTEENVTKESSYHRYKAEQDFTRENLNDAIENSFYDQGGKDEMKAKVEKYYENSAAKGYGSVKDDGIHDISDEELLNYSKSLEGLATGEIAPMFKGTGGGKQYDMPLSMDELKNIGMISEVPKNQY